MTIYINGTTGISGADGSASTPALQGTDTNTGTFFPAADTVAWATGGSERVRVDSSGNVGIGTSSPNAKLEVSGSIRSSGSNGIVTFLNGNTSGGAKIGVYTAAGTADGYLAFEGYSKEYGRFDSSGNLLVGKTTTATATLGWSFGSDRGNAKFSAGNYMIFNRDDNDILINFRRSDSSVGTITVNTTNTAYNTSSDYRLKEDIAPMTGALAKVAALKPCTYKWKVDGSDGQGFIAHELAEVAPGCVTGAKDAVDADGNPVYQGIDTSFLVATLTAAIQELTARVQALEAKA
jgi:hypothetical protein